MEKKVGIVLLNFNGMATSFNGKPMLTQTLDWLKKTSYTNYKTVFVDDASPDNSTDVAKKYGLHVIRNKVNLFNFAKNNNIGMRYLLKNYRPDYVVLLSNDVFLKDRNWLKKFVEIAESDDKIGDITCKQLYPTGRIQYAGATISIAPRARGRGELDRGQYDKIEEVESANGVFCMFPSKVLHKVGLFDENFDFGSEDDDLFIRISRAGFKHLFDGEVAVTHLEGYTSTAAVDKKKKDATFYKNQISFAYFVFKNYHYLKKLLGFGMFFGNSLFTIEGKDRKRALSSIRFKDRPFWRIWVSLKAFFKAYQIWSANR